MAAERYVPVEETFSRPSSHGGEHLRLIPPTPHVPIPHARYFPEGEEEQYFAHYGREKQKRKENLLFYDPATVTAEQRDYIEALGEYYEAKLQALRSEQVGVVFQAILPDLENSRYREDA